MPAVRPKILFSLLVILSFLSAANSGWAAPQHHSRKHLVAAQPAVEPPAPAPVPLRPEQMPAIPPQVTYQQNQLTIVAQNSTLSDILRAVRTQTGAAVDFPANATERVVAHLGPGPARDVMAALLNGSHFDYVMLGSASDPSAVERIILTSKTGAAPDNAPVYQAASQPNQAPQPAAQQQTDVQDVAEDDFSNDADAEDDQLPDQPAQAEQVPANVQPGVKTPEQFLQELQRQQQQQQQLVQPGQPGPNGLPPGVPLPPEQQPQAPPQ
jgi:hypothetical protein